MKPQPRRTKPAPAETGRTPNYGGLTEKKAREKLDPQFHHGGRTQTPDADVNPAADLQVDEDRRSPTPENSPTTRRIPKAEQPR